MAPHSTSNTPSGSPTHAQAQQQQQQARGMAYSQSQPVFSGLPSASMAEDGEHVTSSSGRASAAAAAAADAADEFSLTALSSGGVYSPQTAVLPERKQSSTAAVTAPPVVLPTRTPMWKSLPGAASVHHAQRSLAAIYASPSRAPPPPLAVSSNTAAAASAKSPLKRLLTGSASATQLLSPPARAAAGEEKSSTVVSSPATASADPTSQQAPLRRNLSDRSFPPALFQVRTVANPSVDARRTGAPILGATLRKALRRTRVNPDTGAVETDSEGEREARREMEEEQRQSSWWKPSNKALTRNPSTLLPKKSKRKGGKEDADVDAGEDDGDAIAAQPKQVLQVSLPRATASVTLTSAQAAAAARLSDKVAAAQLHLRKEDDPKSSVEYLERKHRKHKEQLSEFL
jgi:hypothetical protein